MGFVRIPRCPIAHRSSPLPCAAGEGRGGGDQNPRSDRIHPPPARLPPPCRRRLLPGTSAGRYRRPLHLPRPRRHEQHRQQADRRQLPPLPKRRTRRQHPGSCARTTARGRACNTGQTPARCRPQNRDPPRRLHLGRRRHPCQTNRQKQRTHQSPRSPGEQPPLPARPELQQRPARQRRLLPRPRHPPRQTGQRSRCHPGNQRPAPGTCRRKNRRHRHPNRQTNLGLPPTGRHTHHHRNRNPTAGQLPATWPQRRRNLRSGAARSEPRQTAGRLHPWRRRRHRTRHLQML